MAVVGRSQRGNTIGLVADFVLNRPTASFPDRVLEAASLQFLDTIGVAAASSSMQAGRIGRDVACLLFGAGDADHAVRLLFDGRQASMAGAAYAASTQIDNLDGHDGYSPTKGHIGVVAGPALAVLAQSRPQLTGREALATLAIGYEVAGRAGIALHATVSDYHTSGAWNALGVVAMAARVFGFDEGQLRQAFGIAEYHGPRSQMMREIANPTMLHDGSGWGALAGFSAAVLAQRGFTGAPALTVEAEPAAAHWADLGTFWQTEHQYIKPYPVCRWAHAAIDAVRVLCSRHDLRAQDIAEVRVNSFRYATDLFAGMPDTTSKAQYSLPFAVAAMIVHGRIGIEHISGGGLSDPAVADMLARIHVSENERHNARFPEGRWADVQIRTTDAKVHDSGDIHARGGPEAPFGREDVVAKFMELAAPALGGQRAGAIRDATLGLVRKDSRFSDLGALLCDPTGGRPDHAL